MDVGVSIASKVGPNIHNVLCELDIFGGGRHTIDIKSTENSGYFRAVALLVVAVRSRVVCLLKDMIKSSTINLYTVAG